MNSQSELFKGTTRGWLCFSEDSDELGRVGEGYSDRLGESYVWKADLGNGRAIGVGDAIAIWDGKLLLGVSWIESIEEFSAQRTSFRCPTCLAADVRPRKNKSPRLRCAKCKAVFEKATEEVSTAEYRRAWYEAGWCTPERAILENECRSLSVHPKSQLSLRDLHLDKLELLVKGFGPRVNSPFFRRDTKIHGGHRLSTVKTRIGQNNFRELLRRKFGDICAITGLNHPTALEAAHLYRYSELGEHLEDGGLLLRRDIHRLFDNGLIRIAPKSLTVEISREILHFEEYGRLQGSSLKVPVSDKTVKWLDLHWQEYSC